MDLLRRLLRVSAIAAVLVASTALAQLGVVTRPANQLIGAEKGEQLGEYLLVPSDVELKLRPVVVLKLDTAAANVIVECSDIKRVPVPFITIDRQTYLLTQPGKQWLDILVVDFDQNLFAKKTVVVDVGPDPPGPDPDDPDPDDPDPPPPDPTGPFDALASRVATVAAGISDANRMMIRVTCEKAADRMQRFEYRQLDQARQFIKQNWPTSEGAKTLYKLIAEDAASRVLSWQEAQAYYREIGKGVAIVK